MQLKKENIDKNRQTFNFINLYVLQFVIHDTRFTDLVANHKLQNRKNQNYKHSQKEIIILCSSRYTVIRSKVRVKSESITKSFQGTQIKYSQTCLQRSSRITEKLTVRSRWPLRASAAYESLFPS